jgi:hypothetical protein
MYNKISKLVSLIQSLPRDIQYIKEALGRIEARQLRSKPSSDIDIEFRTYSQWGEDGIIQYLLSNLPTKNNVFVEFGVEDYTESNTRFLLSCYPWTGLVIDGSAENIAKIKASNAYSLMRFSAVQSFITAENINEVLLSNLAGANVDLLSIDIDGNDYWVWKAIDTIAPLLVIVEYNSLFGPNLPLTIPYNPSFVRSEAHFSQLYYGCSLTSLSDLATSKGYSLVYVNNAGNNAFFVRDDCCGTLTVKSPDESYRKPQFRESLDKYGRRSHLEFDDARQLISSTNVYNTRTQIESLFSAYL